MGNDRPLLRSKDVAHILDCSPDHVTLLAQKGELEASKTGRFWRFRKVDVEAYKRQTEKRLLASLLLNK